MSKQFFYLLMLFAVIPFLGGCTTNPATGETQFTGLITPQKEDEIGAQAHPSIIEREGLYGDENIQQYVRGIGQAVAKDTERPDVMYQFFVLDTPDVNAFALPGGYIYITRGLMALAGSEAEVAAVLAHEVGHVTGRHGAARQSKGMLADIGGFIVAAATGSEDAARLLGMGSNLYIQSYSRAQEYEADGLGVRYITRAGYDGRGMPILLSQLNAQNILEAKIAGRSLNDGVDYLATHPNPQDRVQRALAEVSAAGYGGMVRREEYLRRIDGMVYGDSARQGFVRGQDFHHPEMMFTFRVPEGFVMKNYHDRVIARNRQAGASIVFDMKENKYGLSSYHYMTQEWLENQVPVRDYERLTINGMPAVMGVFKGALEGQEVYIRLVAIEWSSKQIARFQIVHPRNMRVSEVDALKQTLHSFRKISEAEKSKYKPYRLSLVKAKAGDTVESLAARMVIRDGFQADRFRVLNGLGTYDAIEAGREYKIIIE